MLQRSELLLQGKFVSFGWAPRGLINVTSALFEPRHSEVSELFLFSPRHSAVSLQHFLEKGNRQNRVLHTPLRLTLSHQSREKRTRRVTAGEPA